MRSACSNGSNEPLQKTKLPSMKHHTPLDHAPFLALNIMLILVLISEIAQITFNVRSPFLPRDAMVFFKFSWAPLENG